MTMTTYEPRSCQPTMRSGTRYLGRPLHNPNPSVIDRCWVEFYGFCMSGLYLRDFYMKNDLQSTGIHDTDGPTLEEYMWRDASLHHIRKLVKHQLEKKGIHGLDMKDLLPSYTYYGDLPSEKYLPSQSEAHDEEFSSFWVVVYWATNESTSTLDRVNGKGTKYVKEALRDVLNLPPGLEPVWWPEQDEVRHFSDLRKFLEFIERDCLY